MADTGVESSTAAGSPETTATGNAGITPEAQAIIDRLTEERKAANAEAAAYRIKEKERIEKEQAEQGKFQELTATLQKERDEQAAKLQALEAQHTEAIGKLTAIETARKTELLNKIPENLRADFQNFDLNGLETAVKLVIVNTNSTGSERGNGAAAATQNNTPTVPFAGNNSALINKLTSLIG